MANQTNNKLVEALIKESKEEFRDTPANLSLRQRVGEVIGGFRIKKTATVLPEYVYQPEPKIRKPPIDYVTTFDLFKRSWIMRQISRAIIGEVMTPKIHVMERFKAKCSKCKREFQSNVEECECGNKNFIKPKENQRKKLVKLVKKPNPQYSLNDLLRSTLQYLIGLDDFYLYIGNKQLKDIGTFKILRKPTEVYIEDSRYIFPVADDKGRLGDYKYYCEICYDKIGEACVEDIRSMTKRRRKNPRCPKHRIPLTQTAYVQKVRGKITGRFGEHEIIHGSMWRILPELFGNPKILSVWILINVLMVMDEYNYEVYSEGKVGAIIGFPEHDQTEITKMKQKIEEEVEKLSRTQIQTGKALKSRRIKTIFLGIKKEPIRIPLMEDLKKMQSLEFYKLYASQVAGVYGVTPEFVAMRGRRGLTRMEIDVQNRVTKEYQHVIEDVWNDQVLPLFGIHDWIIQFGGIEQKDLLREAQILHTKGATALTFLQSGFEVEIDDNQELKISGKGMKFPKGRAGQVEDWRQGAAMGVGGTKPETEGQISPRTGALVTEAKRKQDLARLPVSWYETTKINILGQELAINNDQDEIFIEANGKEVTDTRQDARNFNLVFSKFIDITTQLIHETYKNAPGFDAFGHESAKHYWVESLKRKYTPEILEAMASYYDSNNLDTIAREIDNLRARTEKLKPSSLEIQPV